MRFQSSCSLPIFALSVTLLAWSQGINPQIAPNRGDDSKGSTRSLTKVPIGVILVKGAWSSATDTVMPVPEGGSVINDVFSDRYFGISYALPPGWIEKYKGPPPSESGSYVLALLSTGETFKGPIRGSILFTAQDMFFTPLPVSNPSELIKYKKDNLQGDYKVEVPPTQLKVADRTFAFFAYWSPAAQLHWYVLATQIRCHAVQIVLTSRDRTLLESLLHDMNKLELPVEANPMGGIGGDDVPVCIKDYARDENIIAKVDPIPSEHRFNPVPVRIIIDKEGKVKHIHFLSAFNDQANAITNALGKWKFKQYRRDGRPAEVETGILF